MRAVVVGAVGSTEVLLEELTAVEGWSVPLVVTLPLELKDRHSDFVDLEDLARTAGAEIFRTGKTNDPTTLQTIEAANPDYIFVIGWSQLCGKGFLALRPDKVIGYHPAALPRLRGRAALPWTILLDEKITAGSLFWVGAGTDDGAIAAQSFFHVAPDDTAMQLYLKHMAALRTLLRQLLPMLLAGREPRQPQDERYATWAAKRTPSDGLIDWSHNATSIDRLIRAVGKPYPGAFTKAGTHKLIAWRSEVAHGAERHHAVPGQIVERSEGSLLVQTGEGLLRLLEWEWNGEGLPRQHLIFGSGD